MGRVDITTILVTLLASGGLWVVVQEVLKTRAARKLQTATDTRADRVDVVTMLTSDRDYWRSEANRERQRADEANARCDAIQRQFNAVVTDSEHLADVAQAAILAAYNDRMKIGASQ